MSIIKKNEHFAVSCISCGEPFTVKIPSDIVEKAEKWDKLQDHPHFADMTIEHILKESEFLTKRRNEMGAKLEAIKKEIYQEGNILDHWRVENIKEILESQPSTETP